MKLSHFALLSVVTLSGCGFIYHADVPQGTRVATKQVDRLEVGMSKSDILQLLGSPTIDPIFEQDRWDYIYIQQPGDGERTQSNVVLYFNGDKLAKFSVHHPENLD